MSVAPTPSPAVLLEVAQHLTEDGSGIDQAPCDEVAAWLRQIAAVQPQSPTEALLSEAAELIDTLTSNLSADHPFRIAAIERAKPLVAELYASHPQPSGWRDIASAPKDGTEIIIFHPEGGACAAFCPGEGFAWHCMDGMNTVIGKKSQQPIPAMTSFIEPPTHWMPLPPAPGAHPAEQQDDSDDIPSFDRGNGNKARRRAIALGLIEAPAEPTVQAEQQEGDEEAALCPRCDGSGQETVLSDSSPDAHDVEIDCTHCGGTGSATDAAKHLAAHLAQEKTRHMQLWAEYRNFHRSLCARFGYGHDPIHFRRDLVSLEEAIAAQFKQQEGGDAPTRIELKVYRESPEHSEYRSARFPFGGRVSNSFPWRGHRWMYQHTSFDDRGDYDLIWRHAAMTGGNGDTVKCPGCGERGEPNGKDGEYRCGSGLSGGCTR